MGSTYETAQTIHYGSLYTLGNGFAKDQAVLRLVDLVSRSRVSGRVPRITWCLTAHGSPLRFAFELNQHPTRGEPRAFGSITGGKKSRFFHRILRFDFSVHVAL